MPTWGEIATELDEVFQQQQVLPFDFVRRKYLSNFSTLTGRNCILYATNWTQSGMDPNWVSISDGDIQGLMEVIHGLSGKDLDLILHSPGGSPETAAAIVSYLRSKFDNIRVIIPYAAMSAATMISCASNKIVMGRHSFVGPIDPQFIIQTPLGLRMAPAQAILDQFEMAKDQCKDPQTLGAWLPILNQYGPALLVECQDAIQLSRKYVSAWLTQYMFFDELDQDDAKITAETIADRLSDHALFKSHSHHINREEAREMGLRVEELESDQSMQDLVLSIYHATTHTFHGTPLVKIIENQNGKAYMEFRPTPAQTVQQPQPPQQQQLVP
jgi:hypothetical protein